MKNKSFKTRMLVFLTILIGIVVLGAVFEASCPKGPEHLEITSPFIIDYLYPAPDAKVPFTCQILAFLKSPLAPRNIYLTEDVYKEDGYWVLLGHGRDREGVIVARIPDLGKLGPFFPDNFPLGPMPLFAESTALYVDGKELQIGHVGYRTDHDFIFTTILNPFLWPGKHVGKIVVQLPPGGTAEYEWEFEITSW